MRPFHQAAGREPRSEPASAESPPEKQGYIRDVSAHLLAAVEGPPASLSMPLKSVSSDIYPALSCLDTR